MPRKLTTKPKRKPAAKPRAKPQKPAPQTSSAAGAAHRERQAERARRQSSSVRDIEHIPDIADVERRERCRFSLRLFAETYNPEAFYLGWSADQLKAIARIEEAVLHGALYAFAEPRGGGKTTRCRTAILWAVAYAHRFYPVLIGANDEKATDGLDAVKMFIRFLPLFVADFPEISVPARKLGGIAQRASGQTCKGESTLIEWGQNRIVLPTVPPPANWSPAWPLRDDGMVPTSGSIVGATGLTAEGIRGTVVTLSTGEQRRPDLILADDPQTRESAGSPTQIDKRIKLLSADVLGMAGPDKDISGVMPCTVIERGDAADQILDRSKHPMWRGERTQMLRTMPKNMAAWRAYFVVYEQCALREPPDFAEANAYYIAHRDTLDEGAAASWEERKLPGEVSAIQHAMHLWFRDPKAFLSEYQNDPEAPELLSECRQLTEEDLIAKLNQQQRGLVPRECNRLTAFVDVQSEVLFWTVCGWTEHFGGALVEYGAYPPQRRDVFTADTASPTLSDRFPALTESARVYAALADLVPQIMGRAWAQADASGSMSVLRCLIDCGYETETVHDFLSRSPLRAVLRASKGRGIGPAKKPLNNYTNDPGDEHGWNWRIDARTQGKGRFIDFDTYPWKSFVASALLAPAGSVGSFYLPGASIREHTLLTSHLLAEYRAPTWGEGRRVEQWMLRAGKRENHWWDGLIGCAVGASTLGLKFSAAAAAGDSTQAPPADRRPVATRDEYERQRKQFEARRMGGR